jgi:hypothetical protein
VQTNAADDVANPEKNMTLAGRIVKREWGSSELSPNLAVCVKILANEVFRNF